MSASLDELGWPATQLGEAITALGERAGLKPSRAAVRLPGRVGSAGGLDFGHLVQATANRLDLEAEPVMVPYAEVSDFLPRVGPALLRLPGLVDDPVSLEKTRLLLLVGGDRHGVTLLAPDLSLFRIERGRLRSALCRGLEAPLEGQVSALLAAAGVARGRREGARRALECELLTGAAVGDCWLLRSAGWADLRTQAREARSPHLLGAVLGAHALEYGLLILSWWLLGWGSLQGRLDYGWMAAWTLLVLTMIPIRLLTLAAGGELAIRAGLLVRRRLFEGTLKLDPQALRHLGIGQLLGRVIESGVVEGLAVQGVLTAAVAGIELLFAGFVLAAGVGGWLHAASLFAVIVLTLAAGWRCYRSQRRWTVERLELTDQLVENMIGHRTRLAQMSSRQWHDGEDVALARYVVAARAFDRAAVSLRVLLPRGWLLLGLCLLVPAFVATDDRSPLFAVSVGGILLSTGALRNLVSGLVQLAAVFIAWERVGPFWRATLQRELVGEPEYAAAPAPVAGGRGEAAASTLLEVRDVTFGYHGRPEPILREVTLSIRHRDRLLLEGPSGAGKSTLAGLLAGLHAPSTGLILIDGLDRETLGSAGWRRRVVVVPQFHENHVLQGPFAYNLLLGREWPPRAADLAEAVRVCRALDLGPLLERMPGGLMQMVGECGWQLSHGEKSRLYLARALLQGADLLVLDESFAALDPQTLRHALAYVLDKAPTVLVIAHP
jgi:ATP-binding cassette subfamily B protein